LKNSLLYVIWTVSPEFSVHETTAANMPGMIASKQHSGNRACSIGITTQIDDPG
jgi:hypothetical protein